MLANPILTTEEFKRIHNALCNLDMITENLGGVIHESLHEKLLKAKETIRECFKRAYDEDDRLFKDRSSHYSEICSKIGASTVWSKYEVEDLTKKHNLGEVRYLVYKDHWGDSPVSVPVKGNTWEALYRAADSAIRKSGDSHHIFIEQFYVQPDGTVLLSTGS